MSARHFRDGGNDDEDNIAILRSAELDPSFRRDDELSALNIPARSTKRQSQTFALSSRISRFRMRSLSE